ALKEHPQLADPAIRTVQGISPRLAFVMPNHANIHIFGLNGSEHRVFDTRFARDHGFEQKAWIVQRNPIRPPFVHALPCRWPSRFPTVASLPPSCGSSF